MIWYFVGEEVKFAFTAAFSRSQDEKPTYDEPGAEARQRIYVYDLKRTL